MKRKSLAYACTCARYSMREFRFANPKGMWGFIIMEGPLTPNARLKTEAWPESWA